jgi:ubiquinone/menaquinone biosynthesis C-methylase UbiE
MIQPAEDRNCRDVAPFPDAFFNVALCGGAPHLFPDTVAALREIARVMKPGALLAVTTFTPARLVSCASSASASVSRSLAGGSSNWRRSKDT